MLFDSLNSLPGGKYVRGGRAGRETGGGRGWLGGETDSQHEVWGAILHGQATPGHTTARSSLIIAMELDWVIYFICLTSSSQYALHLHSCRCSSLQEGGPAPTISPAILSDSLPPAPGFVCLLSILMTWYLREPSEPQLVRVSIVLLLTLIGSWELTEQTILLTLLNAIKTFDGEIGC